jgi:serine/threonine-protein kinase RsbW
MRSSLHLVLEATLQKNPWVAQLVRGMCQLVGCADATADEVALAVAEALNNCVEHAYRGALRCPVDLRCERVGPQLVLRIQDHGNPMPEAVRARLSQPPRARAHWGERGRGIDIILCSMDSAEYATVEGTNTLTLRRTLSD